MQAIKFVVRRSAGNFERGLVLDQVDTGQISLDLAGTAASGVAQDVSLHLARHQVTHYGRDGSSLWIALADGRSLEIENFFSADGMAQSRLFVSSGGQISEIAFETGAGKEMLAQYQGAESWGKWNPSNSLLFYDEAEPMGLANAPGRYEDETVSMLGAGLALGPSLFTGAAAPAAALLGGAAALNSITSGDGASSGNEQAAVTTDTGTAVTTKPVETPDSTTTEKPTAEKPDPATTETPTVEKPDPVTTTTTPLGSDISVSMATQLVESDGTISGAELADGKFTVTGTTEAGASVNVTIGSVNLPAQVSSDGAWSVTFPSSSVPSGEHTILATATATNAVGKTATTSGKINIDTIVNQLTAKENVTGSDHVANASELEHGLPLSGRVEPGSQLSVVFDKTTYPAHVTSDGAWSLTIPKNAISDGAYTQHYSLIATDAAGNTATIHDSVVIDQTSPDAPKILTHEIDRNDGSTKKFSFRSADEDFSVDQVSGGGGTQSLAITSSNDAVSKSTYISFQTEVPDGSALVVTAKDSAGNSNSTLMIVDVNQASSHNIANYDLTNFDISTIDLQSPEATQVTLTEQQVLALSSLSDTVKVYGTKEDSLVLTGASKGHSVEDSNGDKFILYTLGDDARILADEDLVIST